MTEKPTLKIVKLTYYDEKAVDVVLPEAEISKFLEKHKNNETYWSPDKNYGFFTDNKKVRFAGIGNLPEEEENPKEEKIDKSQFIKKEEKNEK